jgi:2'-5' RNA ligase
LLQSSLIVPIPDAESVVAELRQKYDPAAALGVPAHITLLYPFVTPPVPTAILMELAALFGDVSPLSLRFAKTGRFPHTIYLELDDDRAILEIVDRLVTRWPEHPPYGGLHRRIIPHLTIADKLTDAELLDDVERRARATLPFETRVLETWLMTSDELGQWSRAAVFPLRQ